FHELLDRLAWNFLHRTTLGRAVHALAEDVPVVVEAVAWTCRQELGVAIANSMRCLLVILPGLPRLIWRQQALQIDNLPHHVLVPLTNVARKLSISVDERLFASCLVCRLHGPMMHRAKGLSSRCERPDD